MKKFLLIILCLVWVQAAYSQSKVAAPTNFHVSSKSDPTSCVKSAGTITVSATAPQGATMEYHIQNVTGWQTSNVFPNVPPGTHQIFARSLLGGVYSETIGIIETINPIPKIATPTNFQVKSKSDPTCVKSTGSITVEATPPAGATMEYHVQNVTGWQASSVFPSLGAGNYLIVCRAVSGSCYSESIVIAQTINSLSKLAAPTNFHVSSKIDPTYTQSTGTITLEATPPVGATLEYHLLNQTGWQASPVFPNVRPGTHQVACRALRDGCASETIIITQTINPIPKIAAPANLRVISKSNPTCAKNTGTITVEVTPPVGATVEYHILNVTGWQTSPVFNNVNQGTHQIVCRALLGGCYSESISITETIVPFAKNIPTNFEVISISHPTCEQTTGTITVSATPPTGTTMQYYLPNYSGWQTSQVFNNVRPGTHQIYCSAVIAGCYSEAIVLTTTINLVPKIAVPTNFHASNISHPTCGQSTGTITLEATPSAGATLEFHIPGVTGGWKAGNVINIPPGSHMIYVRSVAGSCDSESIGIFETINPISKITVPTNFYISNISQPVCGLNGSFTLNAIPPAGATMEYYVPGTSSGWQSSKDFNNILPGFYRMYARAVSGGCYSEQIGISVTMDPIKVIAPVNFTVTVTQPTKTQSTGTITLDADPPTGGTIQYFAIQNRFNWQTGKVFTNMAPGVYNALTTTLKNGTCYSETKTILVTIDPVSTTESNTNFTASVTHPKCGQSTGTITLNADVPSEGTIYYSIQNVQGDQTSPVFSNIAPGTYNVNSRVLGPNGYSKWNTIPVVINHPSIGMIAPTNFTVTTIQPVACGKVGGEIKLHATSPSGAPIYYYIPALTGWQTGTTTFKDVPPGTWTAFARVGNGTCSSEETSLEFIINPVPKFPSPPNFTASVDQPTCGQNGTITFHPDVPSMDILYYSISGIIGWQTGTIVKNVPSGIYTVSSMSTNGVCNSEIISFQVTVNAVPKLAPPTNLAASIVQPTCGQGGGTFTLQSNSPFGDPITYYIPGVAWGKQDKATFNNVPPGTYTVDAWVTNGVCNSETVSLSITINPVPKISVPTNFTFNVVQPSCGQEGGTISLQADSPSGDPIYYYIPGRGAWQVNGPAIFNNVPPGVYNANIWTTNGACNSEVIEKTITVNPIPKIAVPSNITANVIQPTCEQSGGTVTVSHTNIPSGAAVSYHIPGVTGWQSMSKFVNVPPGSHTVYVRFQKDGCSEQNSLSTQIIINPIPVIATPILTVTVVQPTCGQLGTVTLHSDSPSGEAVSYYLPGVAGRQTDGKFTNVPPGTYKGVARFQKDGCSVENSSSAIIVNPLFQISAPTNLTVSVVQPIQNQFHGTFTLQADPPSGAAVSYYIPGVGGWQTDSKFSNVPPGTYTAMTRFQKDGCTSDEYTLPTQIIINPVVNPINYQVTVDHPICGQTGGSITINAQAPEGGTIYYSIPGYRAEQTNNTFSNLAPGTYRVRYRILSSGVFSVTNDIFINIQQKPTVRTTTNFIASNIHHPVCGETTGSITVQADQAPSGGVIYYSIPGHRAEQTTPVFNGLIPATYRLRSRIVLSAGGCSSEVNDILVNIHNAPALLPPNNFITKAVHHPVCGENTGSITVQADNAPAGSVIYYSIVGYRPEQIGTTFSNLVPNNIYRVRSRVVSISGECSSEVKDLLILINPVSPVLPTTNFIASVVDQPICGQSTGSIAVQSDSAPLGNIIYYSIQGYRAEQTSPVFSDLAPNFYRIRSRVESISGGCSSAFNDIQVMINAIPLVPSATNFRASNIHHLGCGETTGSITVQADPAPKGSIIYYSIANYRAEQTSSTFNNLHPGTYHVRSRVVLTSGGCSSGFIDLRVVINPVPALVSSVNFRATAVQHPVCGETTGSITVQADDVPAGATVYYSITNHKVEQSTNIFSNLAPNTYEVSSRVVSADGCSSVVKRILVTINPVSPVLRTTNLKTIAIHHPLCGETTGSITLQADETPLGTQIYYSIPGIRAEQTDPTFNNLPAGSFWVHSRVVHSEGCSSPSNNIVVTINPVLSVPIAPAVTITQPDCTTLGIISVTAPLGLKYSLNGGTYQNSSTFFGLSAGTYQVFAQNSSGCISLPALVTINDKAKPAAPTIDVIRISESAGTISVTSPIGAGFTYSKDGSLYQESTNFSNLPLGTYSIYVKKTDQCVSQATIAIINAQSFAILYPPTNHRVINKSDASCDLNNGTVTFAAEGSGTFSYILSNGNGYQKNQESPVFNDLAPGTYTAKSQLITDGNYSDYSNSSTIIIIGEKAEAPTNFTVCVTQPTNQKITGTVTLNANPSSEGTIEYAIQNFAGWQTGKIFSNIPPGVYNAQSRVSVSDGCYSEIKALSVTVIPVTSTSPTTNFTASVNHPACRQSYGTITLSANIPAEGIIYYSIQNLKAEQTSPVFSEVRAGSYLALSRVLGSNGYSEYNLLPVTVNVPGIPAPANMTATVVQPTCGQNGKISMNAEVPSGYTITYLIPGYGWGSKDPVTFNNVPPGTYTVQAYASNGVCNTEWISMSTQITISPLPKIPAPANMTAIVVQPTCGQNGSISMNAEVPSGYTITYLIPGYGWGSKDPVTFNNVPPGTYTVQAYASNGVCNTEWISMSTQITINPLPKIPAPANMTATVVQPTCGQNGTISMNAEVPSGYTITYLIPGYGWGSKDPVTFNNVPPGTYTVQAYASNGVCNTELSSMSTQIIINPIPKIPAPANMIATVVQPTCGQNGMISMNAEVPSGYTITYLIPGYGWGSKDPVTFNHVPPGTYTVQAYASNGVCNTEWTSMSTQVTINPLPKVPVPINMNAKVVQPTCNQQGTITLHADSPSSDLVSYYIEGLSGWWQTGTLNNVPPGIYTAYARSTKGACTSETIRLSTQIIINEIPKIAAPINFNANVVQPTGGQTGGSITFYADSPSGDPVSYYIPGISGYQTGTLNNVPPGTYTAYARTSNGVCYSEETKFTTQIIINPLPSTTNYNLVINSPACGQTTGSITINIVDPPSGTIYYKIDGLRSEQTEPAFNNLLPGNYILSFRALSSGVYSDWRQVRATINPVTPILLATNFKVTASHHPICGETKGSITVSADVAPSGSLVYYSIQGVRGEQTSTTFNNLTPGTYQVLCRVVLNSGGCYSGTNAIRVTINPVSPILPTTNFMTTAIHSPVCGEAKGSITVRADDAPLGSQVYYSIDRFRAEQTSSTFSDLAPGMYLVRSRVVSNSGVCSSAYNDLKIYINPEPHVATTSNFKAIVVNNPACGETKGSITLQADATPSGTQIYYSIEGFRAEQTDPIFSNLNSGTYLVRSRVMFSSGGCWSGYNDIRVVINSVTPILPTTNFAVVAVQHPVCGETMGALTVIADAAPAGSQVYYSIEGFRVEQTNPTFNNLIPGSYKVLSRVVNSLGCYSAMNSVRVTINPVTPVLPTTNFAVSSIHHPVCGETKGSFTVQANAVPAGTQIYYSIENVRVGQTDPSFSNLAPGFYTVLSQVVSNSGGCASGFTSTRVIINAIQSAPNKPSVLLTQPNCTTPTGTISVIAPLGNGMEYSIDGSTYQTSIIFSGLATNTYQVTARNSNGCLSPVNMVTIQAPAPPPSILAKGKTILCNGEGVTLITNATSGIQWYKNGISISGAKSASYIASEAGNYSIALVSDCGIINSSVAISIETQSTPVAPSISASGKTALCMGESVTLTSIFKGNGQLAWYRDGVNLNISTPTLVATIAGNYSLYSSNSCRRSSLSNVIAVTDAANVPILAINDNIGEICNAPFILNEGLLLANDTGSSCGDSLRIQSVTQPLNGTLTTINGSYMFAPNAGFSGNDSFTYTLQNNPTVSTNVKFFSGNGHYYEYMPYVGKSWYEARDEAAARNHIGLKGYLVTITSAEEQAFIIPLLKGNRAWMGASDASQEGIWKWVTGPESGTQFSIGAQAINGRYTNWSRNEPNNSNIENFNHLYPDGTWNDAGNWQLGYIVEYGGLASFSSETTSSSTATVSITVKPQPVATITTNESADLCPGGSLTLNASLGSSYLWSSGQTTQSITINQPGDYAVTITNAQGCSTTSPVRVVQFPDSSLTAPVISINGSTELCGGDKAIITTTALGKVKWYLNDDYYKTTSNGELIASIEGKYTARVFNSCVESPSSNSIAITVNNALKVKTSRFDEISRELPAMEDLANLEADTKTSIASEIAKSCDAQADGWISKMTPSDESGMSEADRTAFIAKLALLKPKLIAICTAGGDITHPMGASTLPSGKNVDGMTSFGDAIKSVFGSYSADINPWLIESPFPYEVQPHLFSKILASTSPEICVKLNDLRNGASIPDFYSRLKATYKDAMDLSIADLEMLDKSCTNCKYLLKEEVPYPVFLGSGNAGCVTHATYNEATAALLNDVEGLTSKHDNYETILTNYLNHRWDFTFSSDIYSDFANQPSKSEETLCSKPLYESLAVDPYHEFETQIATAVASGQTDYAAYIPKERNQFMLDYINTCAAAKNTVNLEALQNIYHYTLYYYDQADNLVRTIPPEGVSVLKSDELQWVEEARNHVSPVCPVTPGFPYKASDKTVALENLSQSFKPGNSAVEMWLYNPDGTSNQVLATTTDALTNDKTYMLQTCMEGNYLNVDVFTLSHKVDKPDEITFANLSHATVDIGKLKPLHPWTHLVLQSADFSTGKMDVYLNGKLTTLVTDGPPALCGWEVNGDGKPIKMPENLAPLKYLRLYNKQLSTQEIAANASESCFMLASDATLQASLKSALGNRWYRFNMPSLDGETLATGSTTVETKYAPIYPAHALATSYAYNSTNQVVKQHTPDGGTSRFWYDMLSRLVVSQNAKQLKTHDFSYTKYDILGRIIEVGQKNIGASGLTEPRYLANNELATFMASGANSQLTQTIYDQVPTGIVGLNYGFNQNNLRKRVAVSIFRPTPLSVNINASYYDYDLNGNVKTLQQQVDGLGLKTIEYDYDLVSGKVNKVYYQKNQADRFYYEYKYDAENRLTEVLNGTQADNAKMVASYEYYLHGPLARMELGSALQKVQGLDYAYTLQGWLKGVNGNTLNAATEIGGDGPLASNQTKDVYAYSLGYYEGDYKPIGGETFKAFGMQYKPQTIPANSTVPNAYTGLNLYNGNISNTTVAISKFGAGEPVGYTYRYDQLNRLKEMRQHTLTSAASSWDVTSVNKVEAYKESITYDGNGNIQTFLRNGAEGAVPMDNMTYAYNKDPLTNKLIDNRLRHVKDSVFSALPDDIESQPDGNFKYDAIGNLIEDAKEGIKKIDWTVYGKIQSIRKVDGSVITYNYDPSGNRVSKLVGSVTTFYIRDAQGNSLGLYEKNAINQTFWREQGLYGSSRLGMFRPDADVSPNTDENASTKLWADYVGYHNYELNNHLGNVMAVVSDKRTLNGSGVYEADVVSAQDYTPFGSQMVGRTFSSGSYRYGFNGKENDNEVKGEGNQQDYGMRIYDPRLGRFLSVDPLTESYPELTPYQFASNTPINSVDLDGLERQVAIDGSIWNGPRDIHAINRDIWNKRMDQINGAMKKTAAPPPTSKGSVDYRSIASRTGIEENAIRAIASVESSGKAFYSNGEPVKRFEGHWFKKNLNNAGIDASQYPDLAYSYKESFSKKHGVDAYNDAFAVDKQSAMLSTSYGAFQIMGFNYKDAGFNTVEEFVATQNTFEGQVESFVNFVSSNKSMLKALKNKDFTKFAKLYNGPKYDDNKYDAKMQDKYDELVGKGD